MLMRVLSFDISASSTGWAFGFGQVRGKFEYGLIKTTPKFTRAQRLAYFRNEVIRLMMEFRPTHIVMEDVYAGLNPKTLILLAKFAGVVEEVSVSIAGVEPYIIHTNTVKAYFKAKNKKQIFNFIADLLDWESDKVSYKKHNDISDAIAQLLCYMDTVLDYRKFRFEKDYGYFYEV
jgi:Holliday junction resolvasome RuvABC endonuclease subunit